MQIGLHVLEEAQTCTALLPEQMIWCTRYKQEFDTNSRQKVKIRLKWKINFRWPSFEWLVSLYWHQSFALAYIYLFIAKTGLRLGFESLCSFNCSMWRYLNLTTVSMALLHCHGIFPWGKKSTSPPCGDRARLLMSDHISHQALNKPPVQDSNNGAFLVTVQAFVHCSWCVDAQGGRMKIVPGMVVGSEAVLPDTTPGSDLPCWFSATTWTSYSVFHSRPFSIT